MFPNTVYIKARKNASSMGIYKNNIQNGHLLDLFLGGKKEKKQGDNPKRLGMGTL